MRRREWDALGWLWLAYWTYRLVTPQEVRMYEDHDNKGEDDWRQRAKAEPRKALPPGTEPWAGTGLEPCRCPRGHTQAWVRYSDWAVWCERCEELFYMAEWTDTAAFIAALPEQREAA